VTSAYKFSGAEGLFTGLDVDGIDRHFGVNLFGHFYGINLLLPLIRKTSKIPGAPAPRIAFGMSSGAEGSEKKISCWLLEIEESSEQHRLAPLNVHSGSLR
jgi:NAD(P)-dependent dehydrogenase (short-subunit alcohol dehydrogenase family)